MNFTPKGPARLVLTNTTPNVADVKFTLYNASDGAVATSSANPRSYRIAANAQLTITTSEMFPSRGGIRTEGWIQATSDVKGLQGYYFSGDPRSSFGGAEASAPAREHSFLNVQSGPNAKTTILVTNPGSQSVDVSLSFNEEDGALAAPSALASLAAHEQRSFNGTGATVRVIANTPSAAVLATAVSESATSVMLTHGQIADAQRWVVPSFKNTESVRSSLVLSNPLPTAASAVVSFYNDGGELVYISEQPISVPANGSTRVTWEDIAGSNPPVREGWVLVDSQFPLTGLALVASGGSTRAIPLQSSGSERILLSRPAAKGLSTQLTLVGDPKRDAALKIMLSRTDGTVAFQSESINLPALNRRSILLSDLFPSADFTGGFLTIRSERSIPIFSLVSTDLPDGSSGTVITPQRFAAAFAPSLNAGTPQIKKVTPMDDVRPGAKLKIETQNVQADATVWVGNRSVAVERDENGGLTATLPAELDPGLVRVRIRSAGMDSRSEKVGVYSANGSLGADSQLIRGSASFQKVDVTDNGLDTNSVTTVPIRNARVEVVDGTGELVSLDETDELGNFELPIPNQRGLTVRVLSQLRYLDVKVLNNFAGNAPYFIEGPVDLPQTGNIELVDKRRSAGAFNILDALQKGNALITNAAPGLVPPSLTVYWSERNDAAALARLTNGAIRTTFFNPSTNSAYILGDRNTDSDEFDDSVILHEYAHLLAAKFSRDDSNGGIHFPGDSLDPRIAWSEGWADFFSAAARVSSIYRDSKAQNNVLRLDIEDNVPVGDHPGYASEASVAGLLWDLFDENADRDDMGQFSFASIWAAFTELSKDRNVYLPFFLERFLQKNPGFADGLRTMVVARSIDFQPDVRPSVTNPFPRTITVGGFQTGAVDSLSTKRTNLSSSSHFFSLSTTTTVPVWIRLAISVYGGAVSTNDLDLILYDSTGKRVIEQADDQINGGVETISTTLAPGTYFIEVRSFYNRKDTGAPVFNSGGYRLTVDKF